MDSLTNQTLASPKELFYAASCYYGPNLRSQPGAAMAGGGKTVAGYRRTTHWIVRPRNDVLSGGRCESGLLPDMAHDRPPTTATPLLLNLDNILFFVLLQLITIHCKQNTVSSGYFASLLRVAAVTEEKGGFYFL